MLSICSNSVVLPHSRISVLPFSRMLNYTVKCANFSCFSKYWEEEGMEGSSFFKIATRFKICLLLLQSFLNWGLSPFSLYPCICLHWPQIIQYFSTASFRNKCNYLILWASLTCCTRAFWRKIINLNFFAKIYDNLQLLEHLQFKTFHPKRNE